MEELPHFIGGLALQKRFNGAAGVQDTADERHDLEVGKLRRFRNEGEDNDLDF